MQWSAAVARSDVAALVVAAAVLRRAAGALALRVCTHTCTTQTTQTCCTRTAQLRLSHTFAPRRVLRATESHGRRYVPGALCVGNACTALATVLGPASLARAASPLVRGSPTGDRRDGNASHAAARQRRKMRVILASVTPPLLVFVLGEYSRRWHAAHPLPPLTAWPGPLGAIFRYRDDRPPPGRTAAGEREAVPRAGAGPSNDAGAASATASPAALTRGPASCPPQPQPTTAPASVPSLAVVAAPPTPTATPDATAPRSPSPPAAAPPGFADDGGGGDACDATATEFAVGDTNTAAAAAAARPLASRSSSAPTEAAGTAGSRATSVPSAAPAPPSSTAPAA